MSNEALQTALNVLAILEEDLPEESQKFRRLVPALAQDFAKAGIYPSEKQMLDMIYDARAMGKPLKSLFNAQKAPSRTLDFSSITARLQEGHPQRTIRERIIAFGLCDHFKKNEEIYNWNALSYERHAVNAAAKGHTDFCLYLLSHLNFDQKIVETCVRTAAHTGQFHLAYNFLNRVFKHEFSLTEIFLENLTYEQLAGHINFLDKHSDFKKSSGPDFDGDFITGLEHFDLSLLRVRPYLKIRDMLANEIEDVRECNREAHKAALIFQSPDRVLKMLDRWGESAQKPLSALLSQFDIPRNKAVNWPLWGDALLKYGMDMSHLVFFADKLHEPARGKNGEISMRQTAYKIWGKILSRQNVQARIAPENSGDLPPYLQERHKSFREAAKIWRRLRDVPEPLPEKSIPDISFDCDDIGLQGYTLSKCHYADPRILFLGYYTGCCEKIGDDFEGSILHAIKTRRSGFYVLTKNDEIRAHSWVWRGEQGQIIIDGWESKDPNIDNERLYNLTHKIADILSLPIMDEYDITDVILGVCGTKYSFEEHLNAAVNPAKRFIQKNYYADFNINQWQVKRIKEPALQPARNLSVIYKPIWDYT